MITLGATMLLLVLEGLVIYLYAAGKFPMFRLKYFQLASCFLFLFFALVIVVGLFQYS
jgi:hypothetical protein